MGLDQYMYSGTFPIVLSDDMDNSDHGRRIAYRRKHPALQGWMTNLYTERQLDPFTGDGTLESFNCIPLQLFKPDLLRLKEDVIDHKLPPTHGYFYGSDASERYYEDDLKFIEDALQCLDNGEDVWYYPSW